MAKTRRGGLGRGLDSLIPSLESRRSAAAAEEPKEENAPEKPEKPSKPAAAGRKTEEKPAEAPVKKEKKPTKEVTSTIKEVKAPERKEEPVAADAMVRLSAIEPNRGQPRKDFDEEALQELADSMKQFGVIQPLIVRPKGKRYEIVAGERRWRAAKLAGLREVPVLVREYDDRQVSEIALIENLQREDLNPLEEAGAYRALMDTYGLTQEEVAERVSKGRASVANALRLLNLSEPVQAMVREGTLSVGHAKVLLGLETAAQQEEAAGIVVKDKLNVRQTEALVKRMLAPQTGKKAAAVLANEATYRKLEETLKEKAGTRVQIRRKTEKTGRIEIEYYSVEDLDRIVEFFTRK